MLVVYEIVGKGSKEWGIYWLKQRYKILVRVYFLFYLLDLYSKEFSFLFI